ncbi:MAG TPA: hypothetical protein VIJ07_23575 [Dermatophilaceae bacterium]
MTEIDLAAWAQRLDIDVVEAADVLNGSSERAAELHWGVVDLAESLRGHPDQEVRVFLCSAVTALDFVSRRLDDVGRVAQRGAR